MDYAFIAETFHHLLAFLMDSGIAKNSRSGRDGVGAHFWTIMLAILPGVVLQPHLLQIGGSAYVRCMYVCV